MISLRVSAPNLANTNRKENPSMFAEALEKVRRVFVSREELATRQNELVGLVNYTRC